MAADDGRSTSDDGSSRAIRYAVDLLTSVGTVALVGLLLLAVSGIWPPLVAIESGSMEPHIAEGDLVFVMEDGRFSGEGATHGVVTAQRAEGYVQFDRPGDVIVFTPDGNERRTPIIHRAILYVKEGENWYDRAEPDAVGDADSCAELTHCPADHSGFITKGDNTRTNREYDQVGRSRITEIVRPEWVVGTAEWRVPILGEIRLGWNRAAGWSGSALSAS